MLTTFWISFSSKCISIAYLKRIVSSISFFRNKKESSPTLVCYTQLFFYDRKLNKKKNFFFNSFLYITQFYLLFFQDNIKVICYMGTDESARVCKLNVIFRWKVSKLFIYVGSFFLFFFIYSSNGFSWVRMLGFFFLWFFGWIEENLWE